MAEIIVKRFWTALNKDVIFVRIKEILEGEGEVVTNIILELDDAKDLIKKVTANMPDEMVENRKEE